MTTVTFIVWIFAVAIIFWLVIDLFSYSAFDDGFIIGLIFVWLILIFGITSTLIKDIFNISLTDGSFTGIISWWIPIVFFGESIVGGVSKSMIFLISGLIALGTASIGALGYNLFKGREFSNSYKNQLGFRRVGSFIIQVIGLISSILGILSFYLDFIK